MSGRRAPLAPVLALVVVAALTVLAGCGGPGRNGAPATPPAGSSSPPGGISGRITVFAAASLIESFTTLGHRFEAAHPGTDVQFSFGPSSGLATQIVHGAPADVLAAASAASMDQAVAAGAVGSVETFARNSAQIAVPPGNPAGITGVADLARRDVKVALCAETVPCGALARQVFAAAKVAVTAVTHETDVRATLSRVRLGEVDAGVVYVTDVKAAGDAVQGIAIPEDVNASTSYPIATVTGSANPRLAAAFVAYVVSPAGAEVLTAAGFDAP